jgi:hypothetical protein
MAGLACYNNPMKTSPVDGFLEKIMSVKVLRGGGASAGVFGYSGADNDLVRSLKKNAVALVSEYRKPNADSGKIDQLANEVFGNVQTLQLTYTISEKEADALLKEMQALLE